jgi:hypothetical protein
VMWRISDVRERPLGLLVGMRSASSTHSASLTSLGYTGIAMPGMPSEICVRYMFRLGIFGRLLPAYPFLKQLISDWDAINSIVSDPAVSRYMQFASWCEEKRLTWFAWMI